MSELRQRVSAGLSLTVLNRIMVNAVPALIVLAAVKLVSPIEFGIYNVYLALGGLLGRLTALGWPDAIARYVPRLDTDSDRRRLASFVGEAVLTRFVISLAIAAGLVLAFHPLSQVLKFGGYERAFQLFVVSMVLLTVSDLLTAAVQSLLLQRELFAIGLTAGLLQIGYMTVLYVRGSGDLLALVWMELGKNVLFVIMLGLVMVRSVGLSALAGIGSRAHRVRDQSMTRYRWFSVANDLGIELLSRRSDFLLLSYLATTVQVAIYAVPSRVARFIEMLIPVSLLKGPLESAFYRAYERDPSPANATRLFQVLVKVNTTVLGFFVAVSLSVGGALFRWIFGTTYAASGTIFTIMLGFLALNHFPVGLVLRAAERMDLILRGKLSYLLNLALAIVLVPRWGAVGMALATMLALSLRTWIVYAAARRVTGITMPWAALAGIAVNTAASALALVAVRSLWGTSPVALAAAAALGAVVYGGLTLLRSGYNTVELRLLESLLPPSIRSHRLAQSLFGSLVARAQWQGAGSK